MSYSMIMIPKSYVPGVSYFGTQFTAKATSDAIATAATATATQNTAAAAIAESAAGITASSAAFAAAALPIAVTVLAGLALGVTVELVQQNKALRKQNIVQIETFFTSKDDLLQALARYDKKGECELFVNDEDHTITARYKLEDYVFRRNDQTGCYILTIKNAGICEEVLQQVNNIQDEYCRSVKETLVRRLYEKSAQNGWVIEEDYEDEEETRTISIRV